jgi:hypothetical protein
VRVVSAFHYIVALKIDERRTCELPIRENCGAGTNRVDSERIS